MRRESEAMHSTLSPALNYYAKLSRTSTIRCTSAQPIHANAYTFDAITHIKLGTFISHISLLHTALKGDQDGRVAPRAAGISIVVGADGHSIMSCVRHICLYMLGCGIKIVFATMNRYCYISDKYTQRGMIV